MEKAKIPCYVLPANKVAKKRGDRIKTDRRDARLIGRELRSESIRPISVPEAEDEAARDLLRCRQGIKEDLRRVKQRLLKFLLRHGHIFTEGETNWTQIHWRWMNKIEFKHEHEKMVFEEYRSQIQSLEERVTRLEKQIVETAESPRYKTKVRRLRAFKGIDYIIALSVICEIGDFRRFANAKSFMSYLGLVPSENSSGGRRKQGGITKAGNRHLRTLLIEASWHYTRRAYIGKALGKRRQECSLSEIEIADRALHRLNKKYIRLLLKGGKYKNVAVTAVARELAGFIWATQIAHVA
jgi:transposase